MLKYLVREGVRVFAIGAAALVFSATHAFAVPTEMVMDTAVPGDGSVYVYHGPGGENSDYGLRFDLSSDANWGNFQFALNGVNLKYNITSAIFHIWLTPDADGFNTDRHRFFTTAGYVGDKADPKLTPTHGQFIDVNNDGIDDEVVRLKQELGIALDGINYVVGQPTEYEFDLVDWYSASDLKNLFLNNNGIVNLGSSDDSIVYQGQLTVTAIPNPEPATIILFGSGLIGLVAWRMKKSQA